MREYATSWQTRNVGNGYRHVAPERCSSRASSAPHKLDLPFNIFFYCAVRFSFDRYKNSIATQVRSGSTILAYLVRAASWPISKPWRKRISRSRSPPHCISPHCLLTFFASARVIRVRRCVTGVQQSDFRGVFAYRRIGCLSVTNFYEKRRRARSQRYAART